MGNWSSILPSSLSSVETWLVQLFLLLGLLTIGPWLALLTYDIILFIVRAIYNELLSLLRLRSRGADGQPSETSFGSENGGSGSDELKIVDWRGGVGTGAGNESLGDASGDSGGEDVGISGEDVGGRTAGDDDDDDNDDGGGGGGYDKRSPIIGKSAGELGREDRGDDQMKTRQRR